MITCEGLNVIKRIRNSGKYYRRVAGQSTDDFVTADALFEAIFHFEQSDSPKEIHELAPQAYELLYLHGDWTRAYQVAQQALKASRSLNDTKGIANWLVRIAGWESDHDKVKEASAFISNRRWISCRNLEKRVPREISMPIK